MAFIELQDAPKDALAQLEGLIAKYEGSGSLDIVPWLRRRVDGLRAKIFKSMDTDEILQS